MSLKQRNKQLKDIIGEEDAPIIDLIQKILTHEKHIDVRQVDLENKSIIGKGSYGTVYSTFLKSKNEKVALKEFQAIPLKQSSQDKYVQQLISEIDIFSQIQGIQSDSILEFIGFTFQYTPNKQFVKFYIIMELCQGSLENYIEYIKENKELTMNDILSFMYQIFKVLAICEQENIAHRDLKPQNIMIQNFNRFKIKIGDFSDSVKKLDKFQKSTIQTVHGTPQYFSPQLLYRYNNENEKIQYNSFKSDLYSVGVIIVQICQLNYFEQWDRNAELVQNPFNYYGQNNLGPCSDQWDNIFKQIQQQYQLQEGDALFSLLKQCLAFKEADRPQFFQIYQSFLSYYPQYQDIPDQHVDLDARQQEYHNQVQILPQKQPEKHQDIQKPRVKATIQQLLRKFSQDSSSPDMNVESKRKEIFDRYQQQEYKEKQYQQQQLQQKQQQQQGKKKNSVSVKCINYMENHCLACMGFFTLGVLAFGFVFALPIVFSVFVSGVNCEEYEEGFCDYGWILAGMVIVNVIFTFGSMFVLEKFIQG